MNIESTLSIVASIIAIGGVILSGYKLVKEKPLTVLMNELADKGTSIKRQHKILSIINKRLALYNKQISSSYIKSFHSNGRSKLAIFYDICNENSIEPTTEICKLLLGYDESKFRNEWTARHFKSNTSETKTQISQEEPTKPNSYLKNSKGTSIVYMSALLATQYPDTCKRLTDILNKHKISFAFLEGTKDI